MDCMHYGVPKGTSWVEVTSNSKPVALAIISLFEGIKRIDNFYFVINEVMLNREEIKPVALAIIELLSLKASVS